MGRSYKKKPPRERDFKRRDRYMKSDGNSVVSWYDSKTHIWLRFASDEETKNF